MTKTPAGEMSYTLRAPQLPANAGDELKVIFDKTTFDSTISLVALLAAQRAFAPATGNPTTLINHAASRLKGLS